MPRPLRIQEAGYLHHVVCRGNDRQHIFQDLDDFHFYCELLNQARVKFPVKIYNFVIMGNHIHLLVEPIEDGSLSKFMEMVTKGYAKYFNKTYQRVGHVFQGRFKSFIVQEESYFFMCSRYIDLNPVKANMVANPEEYQWSGYKYLAKGEITAISLDKHPLYEQMGETEIERQISYRALVRAGQRDELDLLNRRAGVLGDRAFKQTFK